MAVSLKSAMAANVYVSFQYILMSAVSIVLTVFVLLVCGFCMRFKKQRSHSFKGSNDNLKRAPTRLTKLTPNQDVFTVNETKTAAYGVENVSFTPSEPEEKASKKTGINVVVVPSEAGKSQAGQQPVTNGSADPQRIPTRDTPFSLKHRRLPSVPYTTGDDILIHQLSSIQNSDGDPEEPPAYEELFVGKGAVDVRSSGEAGNDVFAEDLSGHSHEDSNDVEEEVEWPPVPHVTFLNMHAYSDVDNAIMPNNEGMVSVEQTFAEKEDRQHAQPSVRTPGDGKESLMDPSTQSSRPPDLSWRFHPLPLKIDTENTTNVDKKGTRDLYGTVKKNVKHAGSMASSPSFEEVTEHDDDPPPPVPIKRFNIEDLQDFEDPLPPPPILEVD